MVFFFIFFGHCRNEGYSDIDDKAPIFLVNAAKFIRHGFVLQYDLGKITILDLSWTDTSQFAMLPLETFLNDLKLTMGTPPSEHEQSMVDLCHRYVHGHYAYFVAKVSI